MRYSTAYPKGAERIKKSSKAYRHVHFAVMAIENAAKRMKIPSWEMYRRLKAQNLIRNRLLSHYDALHTQGIDWVAEDTVETLLNWEAAEQSDSIPQYGLQLMSDGYIVENILSELRGQTAAPLSSANS